MPVLFRLPFACRGFGLIIQLAPILQYVLCATLLADRTALLALYADTNGHNWDRNDGWLTGDPCADGWYGIGCSPSTNCSNVPCQVVSISLRSNSLSGSLLSTQFPASLTTLDVSDNEIGGGFPVHLSEASPFASLNLSYNMLTGSVSPLPPLVTDLLLDNNYFSQANTTALALSVTRAFSIACNRLPCENALFTSTSSTPIRECVCPESQEAILETSPSGSALRCSKCGTGHVSVASYTGLETTTCVHPAYSPPYKIKNGESLLAVGIDPSAKRKQCTACRFPNRCLNGTCTENYAGTNCEICRNEFIQAQGSCLSCPTASVPYPFLVMIGFCAVLVFVISLRGLTAESACKIRSFVNFCQYMLLASEVGVTRSPTLTAIVNFFSWNYFGAEMLSLECFTDSNQIFYAYWSCAVLPLVLFAVGFLLYRRIGGRLAGKDLSKKPSKSDLTKNKKSSVEFDRNSKEIMLLRALVLAFCCGFVSWTRMALKALNCEDVMEKGSVMFFNDSTVIQMQQTESAFLQRFDEDEDVFLLNQGLSCTSRMFQFMAITSALVLVAAIIYGCFLYYFWMFKMRKWNQLVEDFPQYGPLYESYTAKFCFFEPVIITRKLVFAGLLFLVTVDPIIVLSIMLFTSVVHFITVISYRPFVPSLWLVWNNLIDVHNAFELLTTGVLIAYQVSAISLTQGSSSPVLETFIFVGIITVSTVWVALMLLGIKFENAVTDLRPLKKNVSSEEDDKIGANAFEGIDGRGTKDPSRKRLFARREEALDF